MQLIDTALERFADPEEAGVFHDTADDAEKLVGRPADVSDNANPSGASSLAGALLTASALVGYDKASRYRAASEAAVTRAGLPWLGLRGSPGTGSPSPRPSHRGLSRWPSPPPTATLAGSRCVTSRWPTSPAAPWCWPGSPSSVPLLADRPLIHDAPAAYVCRGYVCDRPVTSTDDLLVALERP